MIYNSRMICQIRSDCLITYAQNCYGSQLTEDKKRLMLQRMLEASKLKYSGKLKEGTKKRMSKAIDLLIQISKKQKGWNQVTQKYSNHRLSFITLTIPPVELLTAETGYQKLLKHFLQWLRRTIKVKTYIWKAEFQKNKQLHYHITTPAWIHFQLIKDKWNNLLWKSSLTSEYFKKYGHHNPNSTDIREVKNIENLSSYLKKEYCKTIQNQPTSGKIWDCSLNLKDNKYFTLELDYQLINKIMADVSSGIFTKIELDQCNIYKAANKKYIQGVLTLGQIQQYENYLNSIKNYKRIND